MAIINDDQAGAILADTIDSQAPAISPIKSPAKRASFNSEDILSSQPASKHPQTDEGFKTVQNSIAHFETRCSKMTNALCILKEDISKGSCLVGLQYRSRPHLRPDQTLMLN